MKSSSTNWSHVIVYIVSSPDVGWICHTLIVTEEMILDMRSRGGPERLIAPLAASKWREVQVTKAKKYANRMKKHGSYTYNCL